MYTIEADETDSLRHDLSQILEYVQQLSAVNTEGVEPIYQVIELENVWREDELVDQPVGADQLLALALKTQDRQLKVPKVL